MRCLHCGKRLSLLRKFSDGEFCSAEHRHLFHQQQSDLALARLIEAQNRMDRPRPKLPPSTKPARVKSSEPEPVFPMAQAVPDVQRPAARLTIFSPGLELVALGSETAVPAPPFWVVMRGFPKQDAVALGNPVTQAGGECQRMPSRALFRVKVQMPPLAAAARRLELGWGRELIALSAGQAVSGRFDMRALALFATAADCLPQLPSSGLSVTLPELPLHEPAPRLVEYMLLLSLPPAMNAARQVALGASACVKAESIQYPASALQVMRVTQSEPAAVVNEEIVPQMAETALSVGLPGVMDHCRRPAPVMSGWVHAEWTSYPVWGVPAAQLAPAAAQPVDVVLPGFADSVRHIASVVNEWAHAELTGYPVCSVPVAQRAPVEAQTVGVELPGRMDRGRRQACVVQEWAHVEWTNYPVWSVPVAQRAPVEAQPVALSGANASAGVQITLRVAAKPQEPEAAESLRPRLPVIRPEQPAPVMSQRSARIRVKAMAAAAGAGVRSLKPQIEVLIGEPGLPSLTCIPLSAAGLPSGKGLKKLPQVKATSGQTFKWNYREEWQRPVFPAREEPSYPAASLRTAPPEPPPVPVREAVDPDAPAPMFGLLPLPAMRAATSERKAPVQPVSSLAGCWEEPKTASPFVPGARLKVDHADGSGSRQGKRGDKQAGTLLSFGARRLPGRQFWSHAPADLKWVALGLPLILVLVIYSFRGNVHKAEPAAQVSVAGGKTVLGGQLNALQKVILNRAAVKLFDDFRAGLGSWQGPDGWSKSWRYGQASFLEPGQLALYAPSVGMKDYTLQFLGQIEHKSLNWVFRARDERNYYAMRIVITKAGPLPEAHIVRYMVMDGKEQNVTRLPIPFTVRIDTLYLVRMDVRGDSFTTYIQGQVVDSFNDDRLSEGGVGFFSPKGDKSYLRWVEVTHQYDYLGRLCATLAPYNLQSEGRRAE